MNKIIFCDRNKEFLSEVLKLFGTEKNNLHCELIVDTSGDVLECKEKHPDAKIVTASNPKFDMGGGLDLILKTKYAEQCQTAREFKTTNDLFFVVSVDNDLKSTRKIIQRALLGVYFCSRKNDIILTGLGTGVGGLSSKDFIKELALFIQADFSSADFSRADFSGANFSRADFRWADFRWADFSSADFSRADFSGANFSRADFRWADFSSADFSRADFSGANFSRADFRWADFSSADFSRANFSSADFSSADFSSADFSSADFSGANFSGANFRWADFSSADFSRADFSGANFSGANFSGANFSRADFRWADFSGTKFDYRITPEEGSIIVWKKADNHIIKLKVDCKNISGGLVSRKLRTDKAEVLEIQNLDGTESGLTSIESNYDNNFRYDIGKTATVNNFVRDDKIDCDTGIHFFLTRDEAVRW